MPEAKEAKTADKLVLKKRLYSDQAQLIEAIRNATDETQRKLIQNVLDLVNDYILICVKRNKF